MGKVDDIHAKPFLDKGLDVDMAYDAIRTQKFAEHALDKGSAQWIRAVRNSSLVNSMAGFDLSRLSEEQNNYLKDMLGERVYGAMKDYEQDGMGN